MVLRADAAFAKPEIYEALQERDVKYAIRIPANDSLEALAGAGMDPCGQCGSPPAPKAVQRH